jgi:hypothetical protein
MSGGLGFGGLEWGNIRDDGEGGGKEGLFARGQGFDHSRETDAGPPVLAGACCHAAGSLAHQGLPVEGAFAGDHEVGPFHVTIEVAAAGEDLESRLNAGVEESLQGKAESAGGAASGNGGNVAAEMIGHHLRELAEGGLSGWHVLRLESFLRAVDPRATRWAEERIVDVDCHRESAEVGQGSFGRADLGQSVEVWPAQDGRTFAIEELPAECAGESKPRVVGGTPADADPRVPCARCHGVAEDGADAKGVEVERVELAVR